MMESGEFLSRRPWQLEGQGLNMCYLSYAGCNNNIRHQENDLSKQLVKQACGSLDRPSSVYICLSAGDKDAHKPFCYLEKVDTWRQTLASSVSRNSF